VNVLILDEPTNHLDLWACEALEEALLQFEGTTIVVSHDRYFLNRVVDLLVVFEGDRAQVVHGNYDTYELLRAEQKAGASGAKASSQAKNGSTKQSATKVKKKRRFPYRKVEDLEAEIAETETRWLRPTCTGMATRSRRPCAGSRRPRSSSKRFTNTGKKRWR
jgi:ATP-binding cassette subfamily F protein 3